jgi:prophage antirepressor-like protein
MINQIPFDFEGTTVRIIMRDGEPWFVLANVCRVLGIGNPSDAARRLDDDEKHTLDSIEGSQINGLAAGLSLPTIISESGLYSLVLTSRKDAAKRLKKFVTAKVLPSIRKTGTYGTPAPGGITGDMLRNDPKLMLELLIHNTQRVIELEETTKTLEAEKETMVEEVRAFETLTKSEGSLTITDAAKDLGVKRVRLIEWLRANGWIYRRLGNAEWVGYHIKEKAGLVDHVMASYRTKSGDDHCCSQVRITPKGVKELALDVGKIRARV